MGNKDLVKAGYNAISRKYLEERAKAGKDVQLLQHLVDRLPRGAKVLDAGCGAGVPVTRFLVQFFQVTAVDFAEEQIRLARRLVPEAQFLCQDITELAHPDGAFDAICSYYALIHIPREEHRGVLLNFHRMLKPRGLALLCLGAEDLPDDIVDYYGVRMYWSHYDRESYLRLLRACGFDVLWSRLVEDRQAPGSSHLFVLAQKT